MATTSILASLMPRSISGAVGMIALVLLGVKMYGYLYNVVFHQLRKFPGPIACRASRWPSMYHHAKGDTHVWLTSLHDRYGEVVRFSPKELSFRGAEAQKDIYGHKAAGSRGFDKDPRFYKDPPGEASGITSANYEDHSRMRRVFSNAFSDRALKLQEPLFLTYVDKLIKKMRDGVRADPQRQWNWVKLLNCTTFDIMGDLTFGESLGMLDSDEYHPWVATIFQSVKFGVYLHLIRYFPAVEQFLFKYCMPKIARDGMEAHTNFSVARVDRRLEKNDARPDIWGLVLKKDGDSGLTKREMYMNANIFMIAGTETTATLLSGLMYYLLENPKCMERLKDEIRSTFKTEADISIEKLQGMKYLHACLEEGLRMYPPVSIGLPRITPPGPPVNIDGFEVPGNTTVQVTHLAAYRNPNSFRNAYLFAPERWLPETTIYASDKRHAMQAFSLGPRGCLGKNMAYHEMRLILVKALFNFEFSLCPESKNWAEQGVFILWDKKPLMVQIRERTL